MEYVVSKMMYGECPAGGVRKKLTRRDTKSTLQQLALIISNR